jgi:hypothetical protein
MGKPEVPLVEIASVLLIYSGFALFQAMAEGQPLGRRGLCPTWLRAVARALSGGIVLGACLLLVSAIGCGAAILLAIVALSLTASGFVLLAPVRPRLAWGAAVVAPFVSAGLIIVSRGTP